MLKFASLVLAFVLSAALPAQALQNVEVVTSPGGITAWLIQDNTNPIIAMNVTFRGGATLDPDGKEGLANLAASTMDEGAGEYDSQAFQGRLEDLSISLGFASGSETFAARVTTLTEDFPEALRLLNLALTQPRFDAEPVARIKEQILAGLRQEEADPGAQAGKALSAKLFGDHPYRKPGSGTLETVPGLTSDDLRGFVERRIARNNIIVSLVGDITPAQLAPLLDQTFGALPATATDWTLPEHTVATTGGLTVIEKPIPQSTVLMGQVGVKRNDADFYPAHILNHILGGGSFSSRLFTEVREKRGLVYSVYSYLAPYDYSAFWGAGAATGNERVSETVAVMRDEWRKMAQDGVTAEELDAAKRFLTGSFPLRFNSSGRIAGILTAMQLDDLGEDFLERRNDYVNAVTLEDVNRVAKTLLAPDNLEIIVVGQPVGLEE